MELDAQRIVVSMEIHRKVTAACLRRIAANFRKDAADTSLHNYKDLMFKAAGDLELCASQLESPSGYILPSVKSDENREAC